MHAYMCVCVCARARTRACRAYRCMYVCVRVPCTQNHKTNYERATRYSYEVEHFNANEMCTEKRAQNCSYIEDI